MKFVPGLIRRFNTLLLTIYFYNCYLNKEEEIQTTYKQAKTIPFSAHSSERERGPGIEARIHVVLIVSFPGLAFLLGRKPGNRISPIVSFRGPVLCWEGSLGMRLAYYLVPMQAPL